MRFSEYLSGIFTTTLVVVWICALVIYVIEGWCPAHVRFLMVMVPVMALWYKASSWIILERD